MHQRVNLMRQLVCRSLVTGWQRAGSFKRYLAEYWQINLFVSITVYQVDHVQHVLPHIMPIGQLNHFGLATHPNPSSLARWILTHSMTHKSSCLARHQNSNNNNDIMLIGQLNHFGSATNAKLEACLDGISRIRQGTKIVKYTWRVKM